MSRIIYSALAIFCFAALSCTEGEPTSDYGEGYIVLNVFNSPMTLTTAASNTNYERQLNRLDCFFYVKDRTNEPCVYYHKVEANDLGSVTIPFFVNDLKLKDIFPSGSLCDVFVIANLPGDHTFVERGANTTMQALGELVLEMDMAEGEYDVIGKPFVMTGSSRVQKGTNSSATATIKLARVASKVTMTVRVPKSITVGEGDNTMTMLPVLVDNEGNEPLKTAFHYGTKKSYLIGEIPDDPSNYIHTDKIPYTLSETTETHYVFTCDKPFYTYARSWEKGADNAAYVTFEMPWGKDEDGNVNEIKTYYYQILVSGKDRNFTPNTCYNMIVTVGVLGSTVEALPHEIQEMSYYVLDWTAETSNGEAGSGDREENVEIEKFNYLEVPQKNIEMDNVSSVAIRYNASHKIGVMFDETEGKTVEGLPVETNLYALYIDNGSGTPDAAKLQIKVGEELQDIGKTHLSTLFTDNNKGSLTFNYTLPDGVYSPAYVFITIWLDVNGNGTKDDDERLEENVKITIYPAIYIIGDRSALYSVFVNGTYRQTASKSDYTYIDEKQVGKAVGTDGNDPMMYMNIISISAFSKDDTFVYSDGKSKEYIIGDPRKRTYDNLGVGDDTEEVKKNADGWIKATDVTGNKRNLQYYYPTSTEANSYQVIAPKFRIASKLGGYSECDADGAALRCASYQEHGFPAGRWRLPTTAEVLYIVDLQSKGKIKALFYGGNTYSSATDKIKVNNDNSYEWNNSHTKPSVRCVYDDWYWGSEREALKNSDYDDSGGYQFTWGDRQVY